MYVSGKSIMREVSPREARAVQSGTWHPKALLEQVHGKVEHRGWIDERYVQAVRAAHFQGIAVKNCFL